MIVSLLSFDWGGGITPDSKEQIDAGTSRQGDVTSHLAPYVEYACAENNVHTIGS